MHLTHFAHFNFYAYNFQKDHFLYFYLEFQNKLVKTKMAIQIKALVQSYLASNLDVNLKTAHEYVMHQLLFTQEL